MSNNKKLPIFKILQSIFSALLGVQSNKNMKKDFETGKIHHYVIAGVILVLMILVILYTLVKFIVAI